MPWDKQEKRVEWYDRNGRTVERTEITCLCGERIVCETNTNTCYECGRDYNMSGQLLAPREQWGWDTGETADEIIAFEHMTEAEQRQILDEM